LPDSQPAGDAGARQAAPTPATEPSTDVPRSGVIPALRERDFRRLFVGAVFAQFGMWMLFVGQGWLVFEELGGSPFELGLVSFIQGAVSVPVSIIGGGLADRLDRKRLASAATALGAANSLIVSILVLNDRIEIWHLYFSALVQGLFVGVEQPSRQVLVYDTAGSQNVGNAVAVMSMGQNIARISGPTLGGALIGFYGVAVLYVVQFACFAIAALTTLTLRAQRHARSQGEGFLTSLRGGFGYVRRTRIVLALLLIALFPPFLIYPYVQFFAVFVTDVLGRGSTEFGLLSAAVGFGSLFGTVYVALTAHRGGRGRVLVLATMIYTALVMLFTFQREYWPAFGVLVLAGIFNAVYGAVCNSLIQQTVDDRFRGRVMSLYTMTFAMIPFGGLLMGVVVSIYGTPTAFAAFTATASALCALVFITNPRIRRL
jgi:predicted MFS family arabinose efflux permease